MIRKAETRDLPLLAELACRLWPDHSQEEMAAELAEIMAKPEAAFFLAFRQERAVGFAQCQLRHDYVEGTESTPVGYLEGIYVAEDFRHQGLAKSLLFACEGWAREKGCAEFASDCELSNVDSLKFHLKVGFLEVGRIICFTKSL